MMFPAGTLLCAASTCSVRGHPAPIRAVLTVSPTFHRARAPGAAGPERVGGALHVSGTGEEVVHLIFAGVVAEQVQDPARPLLRLRADHAALLGGGGDQHVGTPHIRNPASPAGRLLEEEGRRTNR